MTDPLLSHQPDLKNVPPRKALLMLRMIWLGLMLGQVMFLGVVVLGLVPMHPTGEPQAAMIWVDFVMFATVIPVTFLIRSLIFRRYQTEEGLLLRRPATPRATSCSGPDATASPSSAWWWR